MSKRLDKAIIRGTWEKDLREGRLGIIDIMSHHKQITDTFADEELLEIKETLSIVLTQEKNIIERGAILDILEYVEIVLERRSTK
tara:strand:+ start:191 stop:445 length:255 start_codon:yes stop_codon:yes gene_type:complete